MARAYFWERAYVWELTPPTRPLLYVYIRLLTTLCPKLSILIM